MALGNITEIVSFFYLSNQVCRESYFLWNFHDHQLRVADGDAVAASICTECCWAPFGGLWSSQDIGAPREEEGWAAES